MTSVNYGRIESDPCEEIPRPSGGKQKIGVFRRPSWLSITRSESSSVPSVVPLESNTLSDDFRDEVSSLDDNNENGIFTKNHLMGELLKEDDYFPGGVTFDGVTFNPFNFDPNWDIDENIEKKIDHKTKVREQPQVMKARVKAFEMDNFSDPSIVSKINGDNDEPPKESGRPIILIRPSSLKFDGLSKVFVRKKDQFKYRSFTNEKNVPRSKQKSQIEPNGPSFQTPMIESRDDAEEISPENFPSFHAYPTELLSTLDDKPMKNNIFHPNEHDEKQSGEGNVIGPLRPKTILRLTVQESVRESFSKINMDERDQPLTDVPTLESILKQEQDDGKHMHKQMNKSSKREELNSNLEYPSDGDFSTIVSGTTENLPLLKAWSMKMIDCTKCKSKKVRRKLEKKRKKAEVRKKFIEELWGRKQFYWRYESVDDMQKKHLQELNTLVLKIAPETENIPKDSGFIEMPLGIQLSTITEGDEDLITSCSPRSLQSMNRTTLGAGSILLNGKVTLNTPVGSLLGDADEEYPLEGVVAHTTEPHGYQDESSGSYEKSSLKQESLKTRNNSAHSRGDLLVHEILVPDLLDEDSTIDSKGEMSDITEDYLHIPFSSPLYNKVLKAFRDASKLNNENNEAEEMNYLRSVVF